MIGRGEHQLWLQDKVTVEFLAELGEQVTEAGQRMSQAVDDGNMHKAAIARGHEAAMEAAIVFAVNLTQEKEEDVTSTSS